MADWFAKGDPYFPDGAGTANGGWIEDPPSPPTSVEVIDLVTDSEEEDPTEGSYHTGDEDDEEVVMIESDADTERVSSEGTQDVPEATEPNEEDHDSSSDVRVPRAVLRSLRDPMPAPGFQLYRHPGGPLWKFTPRKRVRTTTTTPATPTPPPPVPTPTHTTVATEGWATTLKGWAGDQHQIPLMGIGQDQFGLVPGQGDRALPIVVRRMMVQDEQIRAAHGKIHDLGSALHASEGHLHHLGGEHDVTRTLAGQTQLKLESMRAELFGLHNDHATLARQLLEAQQEIQGLKALIASSSSTGSKEVIFID